MTAVKQACRTWLSVWIRLYLSFSALFSFDESRLCNRHAFRLQAFRTGRATGQEAIWQPRDGFAHFAATTDAPLPRMETLAEVNKILREAQIFRPGISSQPILQYTATTTAGQRLCAPDGFVAKAACVNFTTNLALRTQWRRLQFQAWERLKTWLANPQADACKPAEAHSTPVVHQSFQN